MKFAILMVILEGIEIRASFDRTADDSVSQTNAHKTYCTFTLYCSRLIVRSSRTISPFASSVSSNLCLLSLKIA